MEERERRKRVEGEKRGDRERYKRRQRGKRKKVIREVVYITYTTL